MRAGWSTSLSDAPAIDPRRRAALCAGILTATGLAGCGFRPRQPPVFAFTTLQLAGFAPRSPLADTLRQRLADSATTRVVESLAEAQVVLEALTDSRERRVVATTAAGQVRTLQLRTRFRFRLRSQSGRELIAATEILQQRDMTYDESQALAKEQEEALLYRGMQADIASQVLRRLASVQTI